MSKFNQVWNALKRLMGKTGPHSAASRALPCFDPGAPDLRLRRPYYLIPLLQPDEAATKAQQDRLKHGIAQEAANRMEQKTPITDIYVFSHGWHRNLFSGVAAYDRIFSRFLTLIRRGRIHPGSDFEPLFIAFHWHSDPGKDAWEDKDGRRSKSSFMANVQSFFEPGTSVGEFLNDFEEAYELFARVSATNNPIDSPQFDEPPSLPDDQRLTRRLDRHHVRGALAENLVGSSLPGEKAMLAWRCYQEATTQRVLIDQQDKPAAFNNPILALSTFLKFAIGVVGIATVAGSLVTKSPDILGTLTKWYHQHGPSTGAQIHHRPEFYWPLPQILNIVTSLWNILFSAYAGWHTYVIGSQARDQFADIVSNVVLFTFVVPIIVLTFAIVTFRISQIFKASGVPFLAVLSWVPLQALLFIPLLTVAFSTFIFRTWLILLVPLFAFTGHPFLARDCFWISFGAASVAPFFKSWKWFVVGLGAWVIVLIVCIGHQWTYCAIDLGFVALGAGTFSLSLRLKWSLMNAFNVFDERVNAQDLMVRHRAVRFGMFLRDALAWIARLPVIGLRCALAKDSRFNTVADTIENQLAFFQMQKRGVEAGLDASDFLEEVLASSPDLQGARLHLIGHSFGALVVANLARHLSFRIQSLCFIQGAIASAWFCDEEELCSRIEGAISNIYSGYDTANGFYYPLANGGRLAAGYVGLCHMPPGGSVDPLSLGKDGLFASLSEPPHLNDMIWRTLGQQTSGSPKGAWNKSVNLDASRLIFDGDIKLGGGHDDIFKDDVVHLLWATTEICEDKFPQT